MEEINIKEILTQVYQLLSEKIKETNDTQQLYFLTNLLISVYDKLEAKEYNEIF